MSPTLTNLYALIKNNFLLLLLFAVGFLGGVAIFPQLERKVVENTEYIKYEIPVIITKNPVKSCESVPAKFVRTSLITTPFDSASQIINTTNNRVVERNAGSGWIDIAQDRVIDANLSTEGCLEPGLWKFQGSVNYVIKGVRKTAYWESQTFEVVL